MVDWEKRGAGGSERTVGTCMQTRVLTHVVCHHVLTTVYLHYVDVTIVGEVMSLPGFADAVLKRSMSYLITHERLAPSWTLIFGRSVTGRDW